MLDTFPDHETLSRHAADWIVERIRETPDALLCLAAGSTPIRTYQLLAERHAAEPGLFAQVRLIKLDEWGGLTRDEGVDAGTPTRTGAPLPLLRPLPRPATASGWTPRAASAAARDGGKT